jgi:hypothetical protein
MRVKNLAFPPHFMNEFGSRFVEQVEVNQDAPYVWGRVGVAGMVLQ